jgi:hypothetical protein
VNSSLQLPDVYHTPTHTLTLYGCTYLFEYGFFSLKGTSYKCSVQRKILMFFCHFWLQHHPLLSVSAFCLHRYSVVNSAVCSSTFFFFLIFIFPRQLPLLKLCLFCFSFFMLAFFCLQVCSKSP